MDLEALRALVSVVETGSVSQAAQRLGLPRSTVTRRLAALEALFGCPLLTSSRDGSTPTPAGARLAQAGVDLLRQASELDAFVRQGMDHPGRILRVAVAPGMQPEQTAMAIAHMLQRAPGLRFEIEVRADPYEAGGARPPDLVASFQRPKSGPWVIFRAICLPLAFKASPSYLDAHGTPSSLEELSKHQLWVWDGSLVQGEEEPCLAIRGRGHLRIEPSMIINDIHLLHLMLQAGYCIGVVPNSPFDVFQPGEVEVLPDQLSDEAGLWVAVPEASAELPWIRTLMEEVRVLFSRYAEVAGGADFPPIWIHSRDG